MLTQCGCKRVKSCDLEQMFFFCWENRCISFSLTLFILILKDLLSPNTILLTELWDQSVFASIDGGPFTFSV